jgi:excisionase family DNA binding protein
MEKKLLNVHDASKMLGGLHIQTVYGMAQRGEIPAVRVGRRVLFEKADLSDWIESHRALKRTA